MKEPRSDEELISAVRRGDVAAFDVLYARYERRLFGYIHRMITERTLAEDLFQDVFLRVLRDRTFDPTRGRFGAWLFTVARNRCLMQLRAASRREVSQTVPDQPSGESLETSVDERGRVRRALAALTESQQQLLLLKQVGELTYKEIAAVLDIAEGTVKSRMHSATNAFRQQLAGSEE